MEFRVGQMVPYPPAPDGVGQVEDLHRTRITLLYCRGDKVCRRRVRADAVARWQQRYPLLCGGDNWLRRGVVTRAKRFELRTPEP